MLDQGFDRDNRTIVAQTHSARQTVLFSATCQRVGAGPQLPPEADQSHHRQRRRRGSPMEDGARELLNKYHKECKNQILIFVLYKKEASRIERGGWKVTSIHGDKSQDGPRRWSSLSPGRSRCCSIYKTQVCKLAQFR